MKKIGPQVLALIFLISASLSSACISEKTPAIAIAPYPYGYSSAVALAFEIEDASYGEITEAKELLKRQNVNATFFVVAGYYASRADEIKTLKDFEIASKGWDQHEWKDAAGKSPEKLRENIVKAKKWFEENGISVKGFRAPFLKKDESMYKALEEAGFSYDASEIGNEVYQKNALNEIPLTISYDPFWNEKVREFLPVFYYIFSNKNKESSLFSFYTYPRNLESVESFIEYAKENKAWVASSGEILDWHRKREALKLEVKGDKAVVKNTLNEVVEGAYLQAGGKSIPLPRIYANSEAEVPV